MKILLLIISFFSICKSMQAQLDYKYDNVVYRTMDPSELKHFLKEHKNALLIDVRTTGEHQDTSKYGSLNIGRLKGAINIEIDSLGAKLETLRSHNDKPIILYCSHSQRSRRGSKLLMENGFKKVYNLNGGMTYMNQANESEFPGKKELIISGLPYNNLPLEESLHLINTTKDIVILDVRPKLEFENRDSSEENNIGRIKNAINIPHDELKNRISELEKYKNKSILVYDLNGAFSHHAAMVLNKHGFKKVNNLLGGIYAIIGKEKSSLGIRKSILVNTPDYQVLNAREVFDLLKARNDLVIVDVRNVEEYENKAEQPWKNLGRLKHSINIPGKDFTLTSFPMEQYENSTILVYGNSQQASRVSKLLKEAGFKDVNMMFGGMWALISSSANDKSFGDVKPYLENYEGLY